MAYHDPRKHVTTPQLNSMEQPSHLTNKIQSSGERGKYDFKVFGDWDSNPKNFAARRKDAVELPESIHGNIKTHSKTQVHASGIFIKGVQEYSSSLITSTQTMQLGSAANSTIEKQVSHRKPEPYPGINYPQQQRYIPSQSQVAFARLNHLSCHRRKPTILPSND